MNLLKQLSEVAGVPGREERVREIIRQELTGLVDDLREDALGNLIAVKEAKKGALRVMLSAHMDEIGFLVRFIDDKGFLRVHNVGGFDVRNLFARQVTVHASSGHDLLGVMNPATKPVHISTPEERKKIPEMSDFAIDLGLPPEEVKKQVRIGDMVTLRQGFLDLGEVVTGKALDDRASCYVLIETLKRLKKPTAEIYAVFSAQEEVGLRGATTSAYGITPDIGIGLDVTLAVDTPGSPTEQRITELGKGVALKVMDSSMISTRWLLDEFIALAEKKQIPYQLEILPLGGTDGGAIQRVRAGVPTITVSIPTRYIHTVTEMVAKADLEATITLLGHYLQQKR
ncbi:MAG: M42 family metallopeptidase [Truepera sp.]|nr:M42 family metallopeptidase [Truepera sp.]